MFQLWAGVTMDREFALVISRMTDAQFHRLINHLSHDLLQQSLPYQASLVGDLEKDCERPEPAAILESNDLQ